MSGTRGWGIWARAVPRARGHQDGDQGDQAEAGPAGWPGMGRASHRILRVGRNRVRETTMGRPMGVAVESLASIGIKV